MEHVGKFLLTITTNRSVSFVQIFTSRCTANLLWSIDLDSNFTYSYMDYIVWLNKIILTLLWLLWPNRSRCSSHREESLICLQFQFLSCP